jgi:energy-coupling factor transporter ATP-binding protein EcfA2
MSGKGEKSVCLIGSPGAGKSTFLAGLELLGGPDSPSKYALIVRKGGAHLADAAKTLRRGQWLPGTKDGFEVAGKLSCGKWAVHLRTRDYDGARALIPGEDEQVGAMLREADVVLLMVSADHDGEGERELDREGGGTVGRWDELNTLLKAVRAAQETGRQPVVAVVLTKADVSPALTSRAEGERLLQETDGTTYAKLRELCRDFAVFPMSAVGGVERRPDGTTGPAQPPRPRGYDELLDWTFRQLDDRRRWAVRAAVMAVAVVAVVAAVSVVGGKAVVVQQTNDAVAAVNDPNLTLSERVKKAAASSSDEVWQAGVEQVREQLRGIKAQSASKPAEWNVRGLINDIKALRDARLPAVAGELADAEVAATAQLRQSGLDRLRTARLPGRPDKGLREQVRKFVDEFSGTAEAEAAKDLLKQMAEEERLAERQPIIAQHVPGRDELERKVRLVTDYMGKYRVVEPRGPPTSTGPSGWPTSFSGPTPTGSP